MIILSYMAYCKAFAGATVHHLQGLQSTGFACAMYADKVSSLIAQAVSLHTRGELLSAVKKLKQVLAIDSKNPQALHGLGVLYGQMGHYKEALEYLAAAVDIQPTNFGAHYNLGIALHELGRYGEALASYDRALSLKDDFADGYSNRGNTLTELHRYSEALSNYDKSIALNPGRAEVHYNRGNILTGMKRHEEAVESYDMAIFLKPDYAEAYNNRGTTLHTLERYDEALASYDKAISLKPDYVEARNNRAICLNALELYEGALASIDEVISLKRNYAMAYNTRGNALYALERHEEALASYDEAISLKPDYAEAYNNRGVVLQRLQRYEDALSNYDTSIALRPDYAEAYNNRGVVLQRLQRYEDALSNYDTSISLKPDYADGYHNKGMLLLLLGDYKQGWQLYEWRWHTPILRKYARGFKQPLWLDQQPLDGKTILLYAEQGLGDAIQFARYVPMVKALGANVILEVPASLVSLFLSLDGASTVIIQGEALPEFDLQCPLMTLPLAFGTTVITIPADIPYLDPGAERLSEWRARLGPKVRPRLGLVWAGSAGHLNDSSRSVGLHAMQTLMGLDIEYHALQKDMVAEDRAALAEIPDIRNHEAQLHDFSDTAGLMAELDLVITVDTSVAHLAGALGKDVWILLPYDPDYRWMTKSRESPWYPTARLFRQHGIGDWGSVMMEVRAALEARFSATR